MDIQKLIAIDVHTHAEVSCCQPYDEFDIASQLAAEREAREDLRARAGDVRRGTPGTSLSSRDRDELRDID